MSCSPATYSTSETWRAGPSPGCGASPAMAEAEQEVEDFVRKKGEEATHEADVHGLNERVIYMLGRLHFRTSYSQNVLGHSKEVAFLSGMIAEMIGMDADIARRCGLLHDIGKGLVASMLKELGATLPQEAPPNADAAVSDSPGEILAIETADCLALLIADPVSRRVAAAHAGWRGTAQDVTERRLAEAQVARVHLGHGHLLIAAPVYDDHVQLAWIIRKGSFGEIRERGMPDCIEAMAATQGHTQSLHTNSLDEAIALLNSVKSELLDVELVLPGVELELEADLLEAAGLGDGLREGGRADEVDGLAELANELVDDLAGRREVDLMPSFAARFPYLVITRLLFDLVLRGDRRLDTLSI